MPSFFCVQQHAKEMDALRTELHETLAVQHGKEMDALRQEVQEIMGALQQENANLSTKHQDTLVHTRVVCCIYLCVKLLRTELVVYLLQNRSSTKV